MRVVYATVTMILTLKKAARMQAKYCKPYVARLNVNLYFHFSVDEMNAGFIIVLI